MSRATLCVCGHSRSRHQYQGQGANWPCRDEHCGCNWLTPLDGHDPYLVAYLQERGLTTDGVGRVHLRYFEIVATPGQLARHRALARELPRIREVA